MAQGWLRTNVDVLTSKHDVAVREFEKLQCGIDIGSGFKGELMNDGSTMQLVPEVQSADAAHGRWMVGSEHAYFSGRGRIRPEPSSAV